MKECSRRIEEDEIKQHGIHVDEEGEAERMRTVSI